MRSFGIHRVFYTNADGELVSQRLDKMEMIFDTSGTLKMRGDLETLFKRNRDNSRSSSSSSSDSTTEESDSE